jgi:tetratricopeptide (TPR) repeat protein
MATISAAQRMDPLSPIVATHIGHFLYNAGRYREALPPLDRVLELAPQFWVAHLMRGKTLASLGRFEEALDAFSTSERLGVGNTEALSFKSFTFAQMGRTAEAQECLQQLSRADPPAAPLHMALAHLGLGDLASAERSIDRGFNEQDVRLVFLAVEQRWKALGAPAYKDVLKRAGLLTLPT